MKKPSSLVRSVLIAVVVSMSGSAVAAASMPVGSDDDSTGSQVGQQIDEFVVQDFRGREYSLSEFEDQSLVVVAFLGTECPLAKLYAPVLNRLAQSYADQGVAFIGVNSNSQDSITDIAAHVRRQEISFPMLKDVGNTIADQFGATRTPEVFVLDAERVIRYQGRIDDQYGVGSGRSDASSDYLVDAIQSLLSDQTLEVDYREAVGCIIGRVRDPQNDSAVTYTNQISRILQSRCIECHRDGQIAPFSLTEYEEVAGWAEMIAEVTHDRRMPPWHANPEVGTFENDRSLTADERMMFQEWADAGAPFGDESELPAELDFVDEWQLPQEPDLIVEMADEPIHVKAEGVVDYQYFEVDPGFEEDVWIQAAELQPGNQAVVHHILVFARQPGRSLDSTGGGVKGYLVAYVPGMRSKPYPTGMAKHIPAGSTLVFQVHYTPVGTPQTDLSRLGLVFADESELTHEIVTTSVVQSAIEIPRRTDDHSEVAYSHMPLEEFQLLSMMPHLHLRGKSFRYELLSDDNEPQTILDVPGYDFNWQTNYRLAEPIPLREGLRIRGIAHYDNSDGNPFNPDPNRRVGWGEQTWDEMMIGYFDLAVPIDRANELRREREREMRSRSARATLQAREFIASNDADGNGALSGDELPRRMKFYLERLDENDSDELELDEVLTAFRR